jgi:RNA polymerase sigma factor (sigma-70 family)
VPDDGPPVTALVARAGAGDEGAWNEIVDRYAPLVWSVCRQFRLSGEDSADVGQSVWLLLVEHIGSLRDPAALPGWLATTTRRECLRTVRAEGRRGRASLPDDSQLPAGAGGVEDLIFAAERDAALRAALAELPRRCRELLSMLASDPPLGYAEIGTALGMAVGSVGPIRARCLEKLRRSPHLAALTEGASGAGGSKYRGTR